jgi:hypothetical protein
MRAEPGDQPADLVLRHFQFEVPLQNELPSLCIPLKGGLRGKDMMNTAPLANRRQYEHWLFSGLALLILIEVFIGFGPTYYLAGVFSAPLPNALVHVHGAVFTLWILLFITQTSLVAAGRTDWHRRLGMFGAVIACLVALLGVLAPTEFLSNQGMSSEQDVLRNSINYALSMADVLGFAALIGCALWYRRSLVIHKRLALIGTLSILDAAYDRWPIPVAWWDDRVSPLFCTYPVLLLLMAYDRWSTRRVQPATIWASALLVVLQQGRDPLGHTAAWQAYTSWVYAHAHGFWIFQIQHASIR